MEKILCAAIWFDDGVYYEHQPINIETGIVMCGFRHGSIFAQTSAKVIERKNLGSLSEKQGFLTSKNRFVRRGEAAEIAFAAGQVNEKVLTLYSEDLY